MGRTSRQVDETYKARGRTLLMRADPAWDDEVESMNDGKNGRPFTYAESMFAVIAVFRYLTGAAYRQCEGAAESMMGRHNAPDHTTICRRLNRLAIVPDGRTLTVADGERTIRMAIDGTGLAPATRGEWIRHKWKTRRGFIRLNVLVDVDTQKILAFEVTDDTVGESPRLPGLLDEALAKIGLADGNGGRILVLLGDKAYDSLENFSHCKRRGVRALIPVRANASCRARGVDRARSEEAVVQLGGGLSYRDFPKLTEEERHLHQKAWKKGVGYGARWIVEIVFSSFKRIFGESVKAVRRTNIIREISNKVAAYNWLMDMSGEAATVA